MRITEKDRKLVAEILTKFMFTNNMVDVTNVWKEIYDQYGLCDDPFTQTPCTPQEYCKNQLEYEKQIMIERYGHCDGLE
jgi:hypothetical protein